MNFDGSIMIFLKEVKEVSEKKILIILKKYLFDMVIRFVIFVYI